MSSDTAPVVQGTFQFLKLKLCECGVGGVGRGVVRHESEREGGCRTTISREETGVEECCSVSLFRS